MKIIRAYVDAAFAGDKVSYRSRMGFLLMISNAPVFLFSKKQMACETSSFGSELIALKGLRYKLRMMGISVCNPCSYMWTINWYCGTVQNQTQF